MTNHIKHTQRYWKKRVWLSHFDDKKHISCYHASFALRGTTSWIPLSVKEFSTFKAYYDYFYWLKYLVGLTCCKWSQQKKILFSCRFHRNSSGPLWNCTLAKCWSKVFQDIRHCSDKSLLNVMFGCEVFITLAMVLLLWQTILYKSGYWFWRGALSSQFSSQNWK
jgi:hypothetical protein